MKFEARIIELKNGKKCTLAPTTAEYAQEMIDYLKLTAGHQKANPAQVLSRHRSEEGIWGLGIGKAMITYLTDLAGQIGVEQIDLEVVEGNDSAKALYEKCGFVETGRRVRALKYDDGTYRDEILMVIFIKRLPAL